MIFFKIPLYMFYKCLHLSWEHLTSFLCALQTHLYAFKCLSHISTAKDKSAIWVSLHAVDVLYLSPINESPLTAQVNMYALHCKRQWWRQCNWQLRTGSSSNFSVDDFSSQMVNFSCPFSQSITSQRLWLVLLSALILHRIFFAMVQNESDISKKEIHKLLRI